MKPLTLLLLIVLLAAPWSALAQDGGSSDLLPPLEPITANNLHRLERHTVFGMGLVRGLNWSPDGRTLAIESATGMWRYTLGDPGAPVLLDADTVEPWMEQPPDFPTEDDLAPYRDLTDACTGAALTTDRALLAVIETDTLVRVWDTQTRQIFATLPLHGSAASGLTFSPDGSRLVAGVFDDQEWDTDLIVWDVRYAQEIAVLSGAHYGVILYTLFDPTGTLLASVDINDTVVIWDIEAGVPLVSWGNHAYGVQGIAFSPDGTRMASSGGLTGEVRLWDIATGEQTQVLRSETWTGDLLFMDDDTLLVTGRCGPLDGWNLTTGERFIDLSCKASHKDGKTAFSRDGRWIAGAWEFSPVLNVWDVATDTLIRELTAHEEWVIATAFSPDGTLLASGSCDNTIRLWETDTWTERAVITDHEGPVWALAFSPDSRLLVSASGDGTARLWYAGKRDWDLMPGTQLAVLYTNQQQSDVFVFSPDGRLLVTSACQRVVVENEDERMRRGSTRCTLVFWDVASVQPVRVLALDHGYVTVAFNAQGTLFAIGSRDGGIELWGVPAP